MEQLRNGGVVIIVGMTLGCDRRGTCDELSGANCEHLTCFQDSLCIQIVG